MKYVVTGGAGFIGSTLVRRLLGAGHSVTVIDNFSTGYTEHVSDIDVEVIRADLFSEPQAVRKAMVGAAGVYHLAANADVRFGWDHPRRDLEQNVIATLNVAEAAVEAGVKDFTFSSTGSVYGEAPVVPTPEDAGYPVQTSLYGASKSAAEGFLAAYAESGRLNVNVFRFVSVLGPRYSHGHVIDFIRQLRAHPDELTVLGDGHQRKSYMHVADCIQALLAIEPADGLQVYNLGVDGYCTVRDSIGWICGRLGVTPTLNFGTEDRGWVGDNPFIYLDTARAGKRGWQPRHSIQESVVDTVDWLLANQWLLDGAHA